MPFVVRLSAYSAQMYEQKPRKTKFLSEKILFLIALIASFSFGGWRRGEANMSNASNAVTGVTEALPLLLRYSCYSRYRATRMLPLRLSLRSSMQFYHSAKK